MLMENILVIDDDLPSRVALQRTLQGAGYQVAMAEDGIDGVNRFRSGPVDLVITDMAMPNQDGWTTIRQLRELSPEVRVVAMTTGGVGAAGVLMAATRLGATAVFEKPFKPDEVLAIVESTLHGKLRAQNVRSSSE
jgi:DNA-binding NtrC family response regulator